MGQGREGRRHETEVRVAIHPPPVGVGRKVTQRNGLPRNGHDDRTIELDSPGEVAFWLKWLDASEAQLREAVGAVGPLARNVKAYLQELRKSTNG